MPESDAVFDTVIEASARLLGLPIADPAAVRTHLRIAHEMAATLDGFALPDEAEPAPVFTA